LTEPDGRSDVDLIRRTAEGDDEAFAALVARWHGTVYRWAAGMTGDPDDADDVAQQVLVRLYAHVGRFRGEARFSTWLYQITRNAARDAARRRGRRARAMERMTTLDPPPTATPHPADTGPDAEVTGRARAALARLPERQRAVLDLVDLQGYAPQEAAELLGVAPATARVHLLRARRALRAALVAGLAQPEGGAA